MQYENNDETLEALKEIRSIMDRSARFISLSGWSGIWAGATALAGAFVAYHWLKLPQYMLKSTTLEANTEYFDEYTVKFIYLAAVVFIVAFAGAFFFTWRKAARLKQTLWNNASRQMLLQLFFPLFAGGVFTTIFIYYGCGLFIAPACLSFYGLALIGASRHTLSDIRYLGMFDVVLGCATLFFPGYGLVFMALGFGVLHILYGAMMWSKYDK